MEKRLKRLKGMARIIALVNQKGGCTKTGSSMQIGGAIAEAGFRVGIIDLDPQATATLWAMQVRKNRPKFPADVVSLGALGEKFLDVLGPLLDAYDFLVIDCPPAIESNVPWTALLIADLVIIPVVPVMDNVWASRIAEDLVFKAREERAKKGNNVPLDGVFLLQQQRRGTVFEVCEDALRKDARLPILKSKIGLRNIYPESQLLGTHVTAMGKGPAADEITAARDEILAILKVKLPRKVTK